MQNEAELNFAGGEKPRSITSAPLIATFVKIDDRFFSFVSVAGRQAGRQARNLSNKVVDLASRPSPELRDPDAKQISTTRTTTRSFVTLIRRSTRRFPRIVCPSVHTFYFRTKAVRSSGDFNRSAAQSGPSPRESKRHVTLIIELMESGGCLEDHQLGLNELSRT